MKRELPKNVQRVLSTISREGYQAFVVGGCVRDMMLGRIPSDYDISTNAPPEKVSELFDRTYTPNEKFGTIVVVLNGERFEVTSFRKDGRYSDSRRPDSVEMEKVSLEEDLSRRDFTINAMAFNELTGLITYSSGRIDLEKGIVRAVGIANDRISEDPLRILRAIRISCQLNFTIDKELQVAIYDNKEKLALISKERTRDEFIKILMSESPVKGLRLLVAHGLLHEIMPEMENAVGFDQRNMHHCFNVFDHSCVAVSVIKNNELIGRLAAFFHDIGKPNVATFDEDGFGHFHKHANESAIITKRILEDLRFPTNLIWRVVTIVKYHDYMLDPKKSAIKKFLGKIGEENFNAWRELRIADILAQDFRFAGERLEKIFDIKNKFDELIREEEPFGLKHLAISGKDLISIGYKEGTLIGDILSAALEHVIEHPEDNEKGRLLNRFGDILFIMEAYQKNAHSLRKEYK